MTRRLAPVATLLAILALGAVAGEVAAPPVVDPERPDRADFRLAFGSCSRHDHPQTVWGAVRGLRPDAFVWLGDVIYADGKLKDGTRTYYGNDAHRRMYAAQSAHPEYAALARETRVLGTWDDHDFGFNNAGSEWGEKIFAQRAFLDFLGEPEASPRRRRPGVYESYTFRGLGRDASRSVRLVLLDTRYFKTDETVLGEEQWRWLERVLLGGEGEGSSSGANPGANRGDDESFVPPDDVAPVDLTIVGSSIQVHPDTQTLLEGLARGIESWNAHPREKRRLLDLVARSRAATVFLSGDVHHAEIVTAPPACELPGELVELTSSGMTHTVLDEIPKAFGARRLAALVVPKMLPRWLFPNVGTLRRARFVGHNFGEVAVDFDAHDDGDDGEFRETRGGGAGRGGGGGGGGGDTPSPSPIGARGDLGGAFAGGARFSSRNATGAVRLNVRDRHGRVKISKTVRLSDLGGGWSELGDRGTLGGRPECATEKHLTRLELARLPVLAVASVLAQVLVVAFSVLALFARTARKIARAQKGARRKGRKEA